MERITVTNGFQMIFQCFPVNCQPLQHQGCFLERQHVTLNGIGVIGIIRLSAFAVEIEQSK